MKALFLAIVLLFAVPVLAEETTTPAAATTPGATVEELQQQVTALQKEVAALRASMTAKQLNDLRLQNRALQVQNEKLVKQNNLLKGTTATPSTPPETVVLSAILAGMPASVAKSNLEIQRAYIVERVKGKIVTITGRVSCVNPGEIAVIVTGMPQNTGSGENPHIAQVAVILKQPMTAEQMAAAQGKVTTISGLCDGRIYRLVQQ